MKKVVVLSADYGYISKVEATIKSILYNVKNVKIYLLNYDIPQEWFNNLNRYCNEIESEVVDTKFNPEELHDLNSVFKHINQMAFARLLIPKLIKEDSVLYLDSDVIVDDSIDELFSYDFKGKDILAVTNIFDIKNESELHSEAPIHQINSGVLLINNKELRQDSNLSEKLLDFGRKNHFRLDDQEVIDRYFKGKIGTLPFQYNYQIGADKILFWYGQSKIIDILDKVKSPKIIHYISDDKPFNLLSEGRMREKWWFYHNLDLIQIVNKYKPLKSNQLEDQRFKGELFTFTNSEDIQNLKQLIQKLSDYHFSIAAWSDMGWELKELIKYPNVSLYPYVIWKRLEDIFGKMSIYLDINQGVKEEDIIKRAEDKNVPVLAFENTANNSSKYSKYKVFANDQVNEMIKSIKNFTK